MQRQILQRSLQVLLPCVLFVLLYMYNIILYISDINIFFGGGGQIQDQSLCMGYDPSIMGIHLFRLVRGAPVCEG